jgi:hypothetical protein
MNRHWTRNIKQANYPEFKDSKYIIIDGQIYLNLAAEPGAVIAGRFLRSADGGVDRRDR